MPRPSSEVEATSYLRLLVLGRPKDGKTCTVLKSAPGFTYVINSDDRYSLRPVLEFTDEFEFDLALGDNLRDIEKCIAAARDGVKSGKYQTVVWDTITKYCWRAEDVFAAASANGKGEPDGRRYWPAFRKHIHNIIGRLFALEAHVIVNAHHIDVKGAEIDNQLDKSGDGIAPMLGGQLRVTVPAEFQDVVFLEKKGEARSFITSSTGVWGPGCRNLPGVSSVAADVSKLWETMNKHNNQHHNRNDDGDNK
jgi:AAA domain